MSPHVALLLPAVTHGHVYPTLPVVRELVARGARVSYFSPPIPTVAEEVRAAGGQHFTYDSIYRFKERDDEPRSVSWGAYPRRTLADAVNMAEQLEEPLRRLRPDVIVHDFMCTAGRILGRALGVPTVALFPTYPTNEHFTQEHLVPVTLPPDHPERVAFRDLVDSITARWGLERFTDDAMFVPSPDLNLVFMPRAFHPAGNTFDERFLFVGPSFGPRARPAAVLPPRDRSRPLFYVSLGTAFSNQPDFFRLCLEALCPLDGDVLLSIGHHFDPAVLGPLPANATVARFVSQLDVLPDCTVFVNHGGMNSVLEALFHGVPQVLVPQIPEQACTARAMAATKRAVALDPRERSPEVLREAVLTVARDPEIGRNVRQMQELVRATNAPVDAARAILSLVAAKSGAAVS